MERAQPIAHREPPEAQALLFREQVDLVGPELALELALEVVEEVLPAHGATLSPGRGPPGGFSTREVVPIYARGKACSDGATPLGGDAPDLQGGDG